MVQPFERLQLLLQKYQDVYRRPVHLKINAEGIGEICVDASRGIDIYYDTLMEWDSWEELSKKLSKINMQNVEIKEIYL